VGGYGFDALRCLRGWMRHAVFEVDRCVYVGGSLESGRGCLRRVPIGGSRSMARRIYML
jgi:hypothetical protein